MPPCPARRRKAGERTVSAETLEQFGPRPSPAAACQPDPASAWVYMVRCADGSLYSGWTNDLARRLRALGLCLMFLALGACAGQNIEVRP